MIVHTERIPDMSNGELYRAIEHLAGSCNAADKQSAKAFTEALMRRPIRSITGKTMI